MTDIHRIINDLSEHAIARRVGNVHDEIREAFRTRYHTIENWNEFQDLIGDYCQYHYYRCWESNLPRSEATSLGKALIERDQRRRGGTIVSAFHDAQEGINGGCKAILDCISDGIKSAAVENYVRSIIDNNLPPDYDIRLAFLREFFRSYGHLLGPGIRIDRPEQYVHLINEIVTNFVQALKHTSSVFRRI